MLPKTMTAIDAREPGGPEVLTPGERPVPEPGPGEVLIEVAAAGINRPDVLQRQGLYPPPKGASDILGLEVAGKVVALGAGASAIQLGRSASAPSSTAAATPSTAWRRKDSTLPVPQGLSVVEAPRLPETVFTVWHNVFERGAPQARRMAARAWRCERHRHDRDPDGDGARR